MRIIEIQKQIQRLSIAFEHWRSRYRYRAHITHGNSIAEMVIDHPTHYIHQIRINRPFSPTHLIWQDHHKRNITRLLILRSCLPRSGRRYGLFLKNEYLFEWIFWILKNEYLFEWIFWISKNEYFFCKSILDSKKMNSPFE